ncbi:MAG: SpoIIE family protein phosphatase [Streptosporangiaceae bacterium]
MVPLTWPVQAPSPDDMRWLSVEDASAVGGLPRHARQGSMLLQVNRGAERPGVDMVTIDAGPGLPDVGAALRDGHSTAGSLGIGLGAIRRLADVSDLYSTPGHGTALLARFWPVPGPPVIRCAGLVRPISGEAVCGDAFGAVRTDDAVTVVLADGLGHGPLAAAASAEAMAAVLAGPAGEPAALLERVHRRMSGTRGGAVAIVQVCGQVARFAGLGNVAGFILSADGRKSMLSVPGIAGYQARAFRQFDYEVPPGAAVILHSDGISSRWEVAAVPGVQTKDPLLIAAVLLAEAGIHRDDAGVVVLTT